ncbi:MAG: phosphodiester glycosidase family protein [Paracoccaceae bacterium]|nr:phosphodiester glycosidase family protein [Paracoccaceae bacterium]
MKTFAAIWIAINLCASVVWAGGCRDVDFEGVSLTVCEAVPGTDAIGLYLDDPDGDKLGTFRNLSERLAPAELRWAMNAGMYHPDRRPVGLYVENGKQLAPLVTSAGPGNFGLLPNGVLCLTDTSARVIEARRFDREKPACQQATQSGPMLVIDGALHPRFLPKSDSLNIRNGVGVTEDGRLLAAISNDAVNFQRFARFFRDVLKTPNALFLDGRISRLYAPALDRHDAGFPMGPMLGVVTGE